MNCETGKRQQLGERRQTRADIMVNRANERRVGGGDERCMDLDTDGDWRPGEDRAAG